MLRPYRSCHSSVRKKRWGKENEETEIEGEDIQVERYHRQDANSDDKLMLLVIGNSLGFPRPDGEERPRKLWNYRSCQIPSECFEVVRPWQSSVTCTVACAELWSKRY
ncbi:hypothetical protein RRG08_037642 [Elysia crispata]|uniref:Uncharacterized protein n=1 Tax=Elysia crispata TaxID=231223 RepID=A0AAE0YGL8_9GAST|nr:hypothetical protein RRG08_037642 [Elysia crispata]